MRKWIFLALFTSSLYPQLFAGSVASVNAAPRNEVVIVTGAHQDIAFHRTYQDSMDDYEEQLRNQIELIERNPDIYYSMGNTFNTKYFVDRHPEYKNRLIKLMQNNKITTPAQWVDFEPGWYSGEFLVRSVAYAKYWAMSTLKHTTHWAHMNDVPNFTPQYAQILAKSGVYFFQTNPNRSNWIFPQEYPAWYVALDGSKVMAYSTEYDGMINFSDGQLGSLIPYTKKISSFRKVMLTAIHDSGTEAARSERLLGYINTWNQNYADKHDCRVSMTTAENYALYLKKEVEEKGINLPSLTGVSFPQPYTSPYNPRQMNKHVRAENLLPTAEMFAAIAQQLGLMKYPHEEINQAWEAILWPPDHNWGYAATEKLRSNTKGFNMATRLLKSALTTIAGAVKSDQGSTVVVFNPLNEKRTQVVEVTVPVKYSSQIDVVDFRGKKIPFQTVSSKRGKDFVYQVKVLILARDVPGLGYRAYRVKNGSGRADFATTVVTGKNFIENEYYKIVVDRQERQILVYDKENGMDLFHNGGKYRFGILDSYHWNGRLVSEMTIKEVVLTHPGPLRATLKVVGTYTNGLTMTQEFTLDYSRDRIRQSILFGGLLQGTGKVYYYNYFPLDKTIKPSMRLGIPYGSIPYYPHMSKRMPVNFSSRATLLGFAFLRSQADLGVSYDLQKWASFGDANYTVDVALDNLQTRSFLKPGFMAVQLLGWITGYTGPWNFSIRGHRGDWKEANAPRFGWEVSHPMIAVAAPQEKKGRAILPARLSFVKVFSPQGNVVVSAFKKGFDNTGLVLRFCEIIDQDTTVFINPDPILRLPSKEVSITDMVEVPIRLAKKSPKGYQVPILGFGIETVKFFPRIVTDIFPPDPISDLEIVRGTSRTIELAWSATGDDGKKGRARTYELRYSNRPLNRKNWDQATRVEKLPPPAAPGQLERFRLASLTPRKTYFLGIRATDEAGNLSPLSNIIHFKTESKDRLPPSRIKNLAVTGSGATWVTMRWNAPGDDGNVGLAERYDFRFYSAPIDKTIWKKKAIRVEMDVSPGKPGTIQSFTTVSLEPDTKYYFAMAAVDEAGNSAPLSNQVFRKTTILKKIIYQNGLFPSGGYQGCSDTTISRVNKEEEHVNYGDAKFLRTWSGGSREILIRFRKEGLPPGIRIYKARLKLYNYDITYRDRGTAVCYRINKDWKEDEANWRFATKYRKWPSPGKGMIDLSTDYGSAARGVVDQVEVRDGGGWVEFDVKKALIGLEGKTDYGFVIESKCSSNCGMYFYSSEYEDDPSKRPVLEISY